MKNHYYLASANTCHGFINHFNYINPNENGMTYILKGGPGTGKSSFMKKVGEYFSKKGFTIEYFFCSSDSDSLDGVKIVEKNVAIVDGTAPHVTEATIPGVKEKIVNLGSFINGKIKKHKDTIEDLLAKKSACFSVAYAYLKTLGELLKIEKMLMTGKEAENGLSTDEIDTITANLINERNPVCYGTDARWANHLYPVFVTESYVKSKYLGESMFLNLF